MYQCKSSMLRYCGARSLRGFRGNKPTTENREFSSNREEDKTKGNGEPEGGEGISECNEKREEAIAGGRA